MPPHERERSYLCRSDPSINLVLRPRARLRRDCHLEHTFFFPNATQSMKSMCVCCECVLVVVAVRHTDGGTMKVRFDRWHIDDYTTTTTMLHHIGYRKVHITQTRTHTFTYENLSITTPRQIKHPTRASYATQSTESILDVLSNWPLVHPLVRIRVQRFND